MFYRVSRDYVCGKHSGFPLCCILWYMTGWRRVLLFLEDTLIPKRLLPLSTPVDVLMQLGSEGRLAWERVDYGYVYYKLSIVPPSFRCIDDAGYIRCPMCKLRNKRVTVRPCACTVEC